MSPGWKREMGRDEEGRERRREDREGRRGEAGEERGIGREWQRK